MVLKQWWMGLALISCLLAALPSSAMVKATLSMKDVYAKADAVIVGTVTRVDTMGGHVEAKVSEVLKGAYTPGALAIAFDNITDLPPETAAGGPAVVIIGKLSCLLHVGDVWRVAGQAGADTTTFQVPAQDARQVADLATGFPSRTPLLLALLADLKAGLTLDRDGKLVPDTGAPDAIGPIEVSVLHKGFICVDKVQDLGITGATCFWTGGLDKVYTVPTVWPSDATTLMIANGKEVRVFVPAGKGVVSQAYGGRVTLAKYEDRTAALGLAKAGAVTICTAGDLDGDGKPDLLLGPTLWMQSAGGTFTDSTALPQLPADSEWIAATIADATGDDKADIVVLLKDGTLVTLINEGGVPTTWKKVTRSLWTDGVAPAWGVFFSAWTHTGDLCVMVVRKGDVVRYRCGLTASQPDNLERLCGTPIVRYTGFTPVNTSSASGRGGIPLPPGTAIRPLKNEDVLGCCAVDFNGRQQLPDFLLLTRTEEGFIGGLPLGYRRYGAFMYNRGVVQSLDRQVRVVNANITAGTLVGAGGTFKGRGQHILLLKPNGELWLVFNGAG